MKKTYRLPLAALVIALVAGNAYSNDSEYSDVLHALWKLSPPADYSIYAEGYSILSGSHANQKKKHELDTVEGTVLDTSVIENAVAQTDLGQPLVIFTEGEFGQYDKERQGFVFTPISPSTYYTFSPPYGGRNLPAVTIRFLNANRLKFLPYPEQEAKTLLDKNRLRTLDMEITYLPKQVKPASTAIHTMITEIRLSHKNEGFGSYKGLSGEVAVITFDEETGQLKDAQYTGTKQDSVAE